MVAKSSIIVAMENAARNAGLELLRYFDDRKGLRVTKKGPGDYVTTADIRSEEILIRELTKLDGSYGFLSEESGFKQAGEDSCCWIIDPLDGTTSYVHGLPHYCISLGVIQKILPDLACPIVHFLRYRKDYKALLFAAYRALKTNNGAARYRQPISRFYNDILCEKMRAVNTVFLNAEGIASENALRGNKAFRTAWETVQ